MKEVGREIRRIRREREMTLQELADKCGLSVSFLSQVERGLTSPSITSLWVIAEAFDIPMTRFFNLKENPSMYVRSNNHIEEKISDSSITYTSLGGPLKNRKLDPLLVKIAPNYTGRPKFAHDGEEFAFVLEGEIVVSVKNKEYRLKEGDSIHFPSVVPHCLENERPEPAKAIWVLTIQLEGGSNENGKAHVH